MRVLRSNLGRAALVLSGLVVLAPSLMAADFTTALDVGCNISTSIGDHVTETTTQFKDCAAPGTYSIAESFGGVEPADHDFDGSISIAVNRTPTKVTVTANGRSESKVPTGSKKRARSRFTMSVRSHGWPHTHPFVLRVTGNFKATWSRGTKNTGELSTGFAFSAECPDASFGAGMDASKSGTAQAEKTVQCVRAAGLPNGFLNQTMFTGNAQSRAEDDAPQVMSFTATYTFEIAPSGKKLEAVSAPPNGEGVEDANPSFPKPFVVKVSKNDTGDPVAGETIRFRLLTLAGAQIGIHKNAVTEIDPADGLAKASANFKVAEPGDYKVEASCAGCVEGSPAGFDAHVLSEQEARILVPVSGLVQRGYFGERLREPLGVVVMNRFTNALSDAVPIDFEIPATQDCPLGSADLTARRTQTDKGLATTAVTLGQNAADCRPRALCSQTDCPPSGQSASFQFSVAPPPHLNLDQGPRSSGGPSPAAAGRDENFLGIEHRADHVSGARYVLTQPPTDAYVGVLTGFDFSLRARSSKPGTFRWSGPIADGSTQLENQALRFTSPGGELLAPLVETLTRIEDGESARARFLVRRPPQSVTPFGCTSEERAQLALADAKVCNSLYPTGSLLHAACFLFVGAGARSSHNKAISFAERHFEPKGRRRGSCWNNCCDAAKHAYWHADATRRVNIDFAIQAGFAHEVQSLCDGRHNEVVMDLINNSLGQTLGSKPDLAIDSDVEASVKSGLALVLWNTANRNASSLLVRSNGCQ